MSATSDPVLDTLRTSFEDIFWSVYDAAPLVFEEFTTRLGSRSKSNTYGWIAQQLKAREWKGDRVIQNLVEHEYQLKNKAFEATVGISRDDLEDDTLDIFATMTLPGVATAMRKNPQEFLIYEVLQSNVTAFDGKALFATDHPTYATPSEAKPSATTTYSNENANKPLTFDNIVAGMAQMVSIVGEDGFPLNLRPTAILVPPQLEIPAKKILTSSLIAEIAQNVAATENIGVAGVGNVLQGSMRVIVVPELANFPATYYLADLSKPVKPLVWQDRRPVEFVAQIDPASPPVFSMRRYLFGGDSRGVGGVTLPFLIQRNYAGGSPS